MNAWVFAGALFVIILGFEFLMFRYVGRRGSSAAGTDRTGTSPATGTEPVSSASTTGERRRGESADGVRACPECGAANDDAALVRYCRHCLARLR